MTVETPTAPPLEVVTPIKPSEAIRLGCLTTTQAFGVYHGFNGDSCAFGAMAIGFGAGIEGFRRIDVVEEITAAYDCPVADCDNPDDTSIVPHLNDDHRWTRERIADWLESMGL